MPRQSAQDTAVDHTSPAQGRFTVQLPASLGARLDAIGKVMSDAVYEAASVRVEVPRPKVIESLVATYEAVQAESAADTTDDTPAEA